MSRGYERMQTKRFEHTRILSYTIAAANRNPDKTFPSIEEFWPLSTDEVAVEKEKEDLNALQNRMMEALRKNFPHKFKA